MISKCALKMILITSVGFELDSAFILFCLQVVVHNYPYYCQLREFF